MSQANGTSDEAVVTMEGQQYYLWRAVDAEGNVLDVWLQRQQDTNAAKRLFRQLLKKQGFVPRVIATDKPLELPSRKQTSDEAGGASTAQGVEQRLRELPSTDANPKATNATIQISRASAAIPICIWTNSRPLSPSATSPECSTRSRTDAPTI